jgi:uncharacterized protein
MHSHPTGPDSSPTQNPTRRGFSIKENTLMENRTQDEELKAQLLETNEQFRTLAGQHAQLKRQIEEIESKPHVTPADEIEEQRLKKLKLHAKDEMNQILARYKHASVS